MTAMAEGSHDGRDHVHLQYTLQMTLTPFYSERKGNISTPTPYVQPTQILPRDPPFLDLHCLPVVARIRFKMMVLAYKAANGTAPAYLGQSDHTPQLERSAQLLNLDV